MKIKFNKNQKWSFGTQKIFEYKKDEIEDLDYEKAQLIINNGYGEAVSKVVAFESKKIEDYSNKKIDYIDNKDVFFTKRKSKSINKVKKEKNNG